MGKSMKWKTGQDKEREKLQLKETQDNLREKNLQPLIL